MLTSDEQVKIVFDRMRAQLMGVIETLNLPKEQAEASKRIIRDRTSEAWTSITTIVHEGD